MLIRIYPDKEKVKSMLGLVGQREKFVYSVDKEEFSTIIAETYYEIIKELITALFLLDGLKATGENAHKEVIDNLIKYKEFSEDEIKILQDLRIKRNKSMYEGKLIDNTYIENKEKKLKSIIEKLKNLIDTKL